MLWNLDLINLFIRNIRVVIVYFEIWSFLIFSIFVLLQLTVIYSEFNVLYTLIIQAILSFFFVLFNIILIKDILHLKYLIILYVILHFGILHLLNIMILNVVRVLNLRRVIINLRWRVFIIKPARVTGFSIVWARDCWTVDWRCGYFYWFYLIILYF